MPHSELHKRKFKTNMAILLAIFAWIILLFIVSMVKMSGS
jgi:hypothetical protein